MTEERLTAIGAAVKSDRLDVTEREAFQVYADAVNEHFGTVNQIYNNAGIAFTGDIEACQFKDIERVMDVDFWGVVNGTKVFLPHLIASGDGHVVNISSIFGLLAVPGQAAYNAAKFAVRGFTEALRQEMIVAGHPVKVTTVHPGGIKTGIARNMETAEGSGQGRVGEPVRQAVGQHVRRKGCTDHSRRRPQEQGPGAGRQRRQGPRPPRPRDRLGLSEARRRSEIADVAGLALVARSTLRDRPQNAIGSRRVAFRHDRSRGCPQVARRNQRLVAPSGCSARNASATWPGWAPAAT